MNNTTSLNQTIPTPTETFKYKDSLDYFRTTALFEWAFAIFVANLTLQASQLVTQLVAFVFDLFKLAHVKELFGSQTDDDVTEPKSRHIASNYELAFKLVENVLLTIVAFFMAKSLINFSVFGLTVCGVLLVLHVIALISGVSELVDTFGGLFSMSSALWIITIAIELATVALCAVVIIVMEVA